jgi:hypothetical protein
MSGTEGMLAFVSLFSFNKLMKNPEQKMTSRKITEPQK